MNPSNAGIYQNANSSTSTLRPRNARLISYLDDETSEPQSDTTTVGASSSKTTSLFGPRAGAEEPSLGRARSVNKGKYGDSGKGHLRATSEGGSLSGGNDLWTSWSSISGIASTLLGSDHSTASKGKGSASTKIKQPAWMKQDRAYSIPKSMPDWGPNTDTTAPSADGVIEERHSKLQAKKREALLLASVTEKQDATGRYKRRDSDADLTTSTDEVDEGAFVYLHRITPEDTLAGVMIKYSCQPDAFRKVNRFWPNDNIQTRKHVFLPVEACSVRGRKVDNPLHDADLLDAGLQDLSLEANKDAFDRNGSRNSPPEDQAIQTPHTPSSLSLCLTSTQINEDDFKHDSWVLIPAFKDPVEILRTTRRALGYFPRARRKSNTTLTDTSTTSTPKTSFDMLRHPPTHAAQSNMSASLNASPVRRPIRPSSTRQRSSSSTATTGKTTFASALRGPGGVGTLRGLRTEASRPGPADDPLNRNFAQYFPDLAPPPPPQDFPSAGLSLRLTPRVSTDSTRSRRSNSNSSGLGEVGGAIEGWVRKFAGGGSGSVGKMSGKGREAMKMGDLIELETTSDLAEPIDHQHNERSWEEGEDEDATPTATPSLGHGSLGFDGEGNADKNARGLSSATEEALLNERFPIRGRVRTAYGVGKDKGD